MQYYFITPLKEALHFSKKQSFIFSFWIAFLVMSFPIFSFASPLDTTLVIEKDIYPKVTNKQERLIEGKKYVFATINERKGMVALSGNFLSEMARAAGVQVTDFLEWNDMKPSDAIKTGQVYYLQQKGSRAKDVVTHVLKEDETLWDVSQKYAMRYKYLLKYNRLDDNEKVKTGRVLWIQTKRPKKIPVEVRDVTAIVATFDEPTDEELQEEEADPELMAEWEELKKTELAGLDKEKNTSKTESTTKNNTTTVASNTNTNSQQGSFEEFETPNQTTDGVLVSEKKDDKATTNVATNVVKYHTVAEAESLYDISKKYNIVMSKLKEWNNLPDYTTFTGQKLIVSQPNLSKEDRVYEGNLVTEKNNVAQTTTDKKVIVKQNTDGSFVTFIDSSGVLLPIPQQDFRPIAPNGGDKNYHIVEKDETIWSIAKKYNLSPKDVIRWNGFVTGDKIDVGDKIILSPSLALPVGSKSEIEKNTNSTNNTSSQTVTVTTDLKFKEASLGGQKETTTTNQTNASKLTREEIIAMGGNPDKAGKEGYDELGTPFVVKQDKQEGQKTTTTVETQTKAASYIVQPQDMLGKIAQKFGVTTKEIMLWNPKIPANGTIYKGDTLFVSQPKITQTVTEKTQTQQNAAVYPIEYYGAGFHAVQPNETIYHLSEKYSVPTARLLEWNNLPTSTIDLPVGKKMIIDEGVLKMGNKVTATATNTNTTSTLNYSYHSVEKGETLFSIAQKYNLSTAQVREWNNRQGDLVYEGEKLIIGIK